MTARRKTAILISGRGSNMASLIAAARAADFPAEITLVLSNRPQAAGLATARAADIEALACDHKRFATREEFERAMLRELETRDIGLLCLAGFLRLLTPGFVRQWEGRILNIHPALLPAYKGLDTHARALADGVKIHGCTAHFVVPEMDAGPIIAQAAVPVLDADTADTLAARVLAQEHVIYPMALRLVASGVARIEAGRVRGGGVADADAKLIVS